MAARVPVHAGEAARKVKLKPFKSNGVNGNEGEQNGSNGSRSSPSLSSMQDRDSSQYLEKLVDSMNQKWSELTRNEPSPWWSPPHESPPSIIPSPDAPVEAAPTQPTGKPRSLHANGVNEALCSPGSRQGHSPDARIKGAKRRSESPALCSPDHAVLGGPAKPPDVPHPHKRRKSLDPTDAPPPPPPPHPTGRSRDALPPHAAPTAPARQQTPDLPVPKPIDNHGTTIPPSQRHPAPGPRPGRGKGDPGGRGGAAGRGDPGGRGAVAGRGERDRRITAEPAGSLHVRGGPGRERPGVEGTGRDRGIDGAPVAGSGHGPGGRSQITSTGTGTSMKHESGEQGDVRAGSAKRPRHSLDRDSERQHEEAAAVAGKRSRPSHDQGHRPGTGHNNLHDAKAPAQDQKHSRRRDGPVDENEALYLGVQGAASAPGPAPGPGPINYRSQSHSHSRRASPAPRPPPSPPTYANQQLSPLSPCPIEPCPPTPITTEAAVQAAQEYNEAGLQADIPVGAAWALQQVLGPDGDKAPPFLTLNMAKLARAPREHPLLSKVQRYIMTADKSDREKLLGELKQHNQKMHTRARELKHKAEAAAGLHNSRWSIDSVCTFLHASLGFLECQEVMAVTRKDQRVDAKEFLSVAQLFHLAASHTQRVERGESSGLVRTALMVLCQRLQALALMRFVYHSNRVLKHDCEDLRKMTAGLDTTNGLSPDDSGTSSQEVHSTSSPAGPAGRLGRPNSHAAANGGSKPGRNVSPMSASQERMMNATNAMVKSIELLSRTTSTCAELAFQANRQLNEDIKLLPVLLASVSSDSGMSSHGLNTLQTARMALETMGTLVKARNS